MTKTTIILEKPEDLESCILDINGRDYCFFKNQYVDDVYGLNLREDKYKQPGLLNTKPRVINLRDKEALKSCKVVVKGKGMYNIFEKPNHKDIYLVVMRNEARKPRKHIQIPFDFYKKY